MEKGYVKLYRAIDDNELLANDNTCYVVFGKLLTHVDRFNGSYKTGRFKLAALCNMKPTTVYAALKRLESMTMIRQVSDNKKTTIYICNWKQYQEPSDRTVTGQRSFSDTKQEEEREKEVVTKVTIKAKTPRTDIDEMFLEWETITGNQIIGQTTKNRYACSNLLKKHGKDKLIQLIRGVALAQTDQYAPRISDFSSLQSKQNDLIAWGKTKQSANNRKVVTI